MIIINGPILEKNTYNHLSLSFNDTFFLREMLICALMTHVKDSTNRNFVLEIVLIYYLKNLMLIFFN